MPIDQREETYSVDLQGGIDMLARTGRIKRDEWANLRRMFDFERA